MANTSEKYDSGTKLEESLPSSLKGHELHHLKFKEVDTAAKFAGGDGEVNPAEAARVRFVLFAI